MDRHQSGHARMGTRGPSGGDEAVLSEVEDLEGATDPILANSDSSTEAGVLHGNGGPAHIDAVNTLQVPDMTGDVPSTVAFVIGGGRLVGTRK